MSAVSIAAMVVTIVVAVVSILVIVFAFISRRLSHQHAELVTRLSDQKVVGDEAGANFFGLESAGAGQLRGNGSLVLTSTELRFEMLVGGTKLAIPVSAITSVETVSSHLGKRVGRPLLKVTFTADNGESDAVAWSVRDVDAWCRWLGR